MASKRQFQGPLSVAVVDDDAMYRAYVAALLSRGGQADTAIDVVEASNGDELLASLSRRPVDCIVLDYNLGEESGLHILDRVKGSRADPPPVVMLTGDGREQTVIKAFKGGVSDYLPKRGLERAALIGAVREAVQGRLDERARLTEEAQLRRVSAYDSLTGLLTRAQLDERLAQLDARSARVGTRYGILLIDIDQFEDVVDRFGQVAGDRVLRAFAARLRETTRDADMCGRYGTSQFLYLVDTNPGRATLRGIEERLAGALALRIDLEQVSLSLAPVMGAALYPDDGASVRDVLDAAGRPLQAAAAACPLAPLAPEMTRPADVLSHAPGNDPAVNAAAAPAISSPSPADADPGAKRDGSDWIQDRRLVQREGDRRRERRQRVLKQARIVLDSQASAIDCTVRDLSSLGARLRIDSYFSPPEQFDLMFVTTGERRRVRRCWQVGQDIGVEFIA
jgi:two-component system cell cycle response regulator